MPSNRKSTPKSSVSTKRAGTTITPAAATNNARLVSRMLGNRVLGGMLQQETRTAQAGDRHEREADRMADRVVNETETPSGETLTPANPVAQAKAETPVSSGPEANNTFADQASAGGEPIPQGATRGRMERGFGTGFDHVRLHRDNDADRLCRVFGAKALTQGSDIYFRERYSNVDTPQGNRLLAHELAHTLQQDAGDRVRLAPDHTVQDKETLYSIATLYGLSVSDLQTANGLKGTTIHKGDVLKVPNPPTYTVKPKETLYTIATRFGVSVADLKTLNGLKSDAIKSGDVLKIPSSATATHTVTGKDTLFSIAKRYGVSVADIKKANGLSSDTIHPGDVLTIPGASSPPATTPAPAKTPPASKGKPKAPAAPAKAPAVPTPAPAVSGKGTFAGHEPGKDYASGSVLERSFVRKSDLKTILTESSKQVFFDKGAAVTLKSTKGLWVEVSGEAYTDTAAPKKIMSGKTPKPITGWIRREWTDMTLGKFSELEIDDSSHFKNKSGFIDHVGHDSELPKADVKNIVMHQTGGLNAASTVADYQGRVLKGRTVASHYVIGRDGTIYLTGGVDRLIDHVGKAKGTVKSANSIGIEHSGAAHAVTKPAVGPKDKDFGKAMKGVRKEINGLNLSPELKKTLLAQKDKALYQTLESNGWNIYEDITAEQKRASYLLTRNLRSEFGIGIGGIKAHEDVSWKTLGEGGNITEFHQAMEDYPGKVKQLETLATGVPALNGIVSNEKDVLNAVTVDATKAENDVLAKEKASKTKGPATVRESLRVAFYADFYQRMAQLDDMIAFLTKAAGKPDAAELAKKIKAWKK